MLSWPLTFFQIWASGSSAYFFPPIEDEVRAEEPGVRYFAARRDPLAKTTPNFLLALDLDVAKVTTPAEENDEVLSPMIWLENTRRKKKTKQKVRGTGDHGISSFRPDCQRIY